jgi:hypothetical protein
MKLLVLLSFVALAATEKISYDGYHSIMIPTVTSDEASIVRSLADTDDRLRQVMLLNDHLVAGMEAGLLVSPQQVQFVKDTLNKFDIPFVTITDNFQGYLDQVDAENEEARQKWLADKADGIVRAPDYYMTLAEINDWMTDIADRNPHVSLSETGTSLEGRAFYQMDIDGTTVTNPRHVYINGGIHAREWISPMTMIYIAEQVIEGTSADAVRMRENYIWHIPPVVNPDGYLFTHSSDRMWRKNRRVNSGSTCMGVDLNRNFDRWWGGSGSSGLPCSDTYRGTDPASEPEVQGIKAQIEAIGGENIVLYMDVHSYSQFWLVPWSGTTSKPSDYTQMMGGGNAAAAAILAAEGRTFRVGTPPDLLYVADGGSFDWAKYDAGVKYGYAPELRPASTAEGGFAPPASHILPSGRETFAGTVANIDYAAANP